MSMTIAGFVAAVAGKAAALSGIKGAPANPPESPNQFPFAITYPGRLVSTPTTGTVTKRVQTVICEIHVARQLLPQAVATATTYGDSFPAALWGDPNLGSAVNHINEIRGDFVAFEYADVKTIGWRFEIDAKQED